MIYPWIHYVHRPDTALDPLGHHAVICRRGGDVVMRHNQLRDAIVDFCHSACLGVHPADVLVAG